MARAVAGNLKVSTFEFRGRVLSGVDGRTGRFPDSFVGELSVKLRPPDAFIRIEDRQYSTSTNGYAGSTPLFDVTYKAGGAGSAGFDKATYVPEQRAAAARLALGILGVLNGPLPLRAERLGASNTFRMTGPDSFDCFVDVAADTGLPLRVRYTRTSFFYTPPAAGEAFAARRSERAEMVLTFADRRRVDGVLVPYSIDTTARSLVTGESLKTEEIKVSEARVNPPLAASDFVKRP